MRVTLVVCKARNGTIGQAGGMPWRMPSDLKHFRATTLGKPIVMGRKTFEAIGKALDGRLNYVVSRQSGLVLPGAVVIGELADALALEAAKDTPELIIGGGGEIYRQALPRADRVWVTELQVDLPGDTSFPSLDPDHWRETSRAPLATGPKDDYAADVIVYQRIR